MKQTSSLRSPDEILKVALEKETQARAFYAELAVSCSVEYVKELLEKLHDEEGKHVHMIEAMIRRLDAGQKLV